jgi:hypothetical protein
MGPAIHRIFLIGEQRSHAVARNLCRLIKENDDEQGDAIGDQ